MLTKWIKWLVEIAESPPGVWWVVRVLWRQTCIKEILRGISWPLEYSGTNQLVWELVKMIYKQGGSLREVLGPSRRV